ncbi:phospholipase [Pyxidicoccus fallax]|uniref:Phospholipase n=1 Tax=Pyxidicoccus fallax TaxID=394095 RepID=A0A848LU15_9BACT|nr:luciferase family protein [Pyxidicoccus fallax]NMO21276.1 phospholipase [Pyxidicoccus fallax]NPC83898.1 phospholipase [Pyxidicoccus fallax]
MRSRTLVDMLLTAPLLLAAACAPAEREPARPAPQKARAFTPAVPELDTAFRMPARRGPRPETSDAPPGTPLAHRQLSQQSPVDIQERLFQRAASLPDVTVAPSGISVPGARAFWLHPAQARGPRAAFQVGTEFAHIHPTHDGSLHMMFPPGLARQVFQQGWGMPHPRSGTPMVFGPRDAEELEVVWQLLLRSYTWARDGQAVGVALETTSTRATSERTP